MMLFLQNRAKSPLMESDFSSCTNKQEAITNKFSACQSKEDVYQKIIEYGRSCPPLEDRYKIPANEVRGCQSVMHLRAWKDNGNVFFEAESEAMISSGLADLLVQVYSGESPETILKCPPNFLDEIGISASLSPSRVNGLYSIHLRMKQMALEMLMQQ